MKEEEEEEEEEDGTHGEQGWQGSKGLQSTTLVDSTLLSLHLHSEGGGTSFSSRSLGSKGRGKEGGCLDTCSLKPRERDRT